jgi:hypothetical protein
MDAGPRVMTPANKENIMRTLWMSSLMMVVVALGSSACGPRSGRASRSEQEWIALTGLALTVFLGGLRLISAAASQPALARPQRLRRRPDRDGEDGPSSSHHHEQIHLDALARDVAEPVVVVGSVAGEGRRDASAQVH